MKLPLRSVGIGSREAAWGAVLVLALTVAACGGRPGSPAPERLPVYPPPPDTARIQFLTAFSSELDLRGKGPSLLDRITGRTGGRAKGIARPYGLALHRTKAYVCDQDILGLDIVDLERRTISFFQPADPHGVRRPANCFVDDRGMLYVADLHRKQVVVYGPDGDYRGTFGDEDGGNPADVFVSGERIYVSHLGAGLGVRVYDRATWQPLFRFPNVPATDSTGLAAPANLYVRDGLVYVSDMLKQRVLVYTTDGAYVRTIGRPGLGPSTFTRPKGVAVDRQGLVYVVDAAFENVQVFRPDGRLLMFFGGPGNQPGDMVLPAKVVVDYDHVSYFRRYARPGFEIQYLLWVTNQYGPRKIAVYGFVGPLPPAAHAATRP